MSFRTTISWYKKTLFSNNELSKKRKQKIHHAIQVLKSFTQCFKPLGTDGAGTVCPFLPNYTESDAAQGRQGLPSDNGGSRPWPGPAEAGSSEGGAGGR